MASYFWLLNLFMLVPAGLLSDKLRVRKPLVLIGDVAAWWRSGGLNVLQSIAAVSVGDDDVCARRPVAFAFILVRAIFELLEDDLRPRCRRADGHSFS
jgi:hypothetical protein